MGEVGATLHIPQMWEERANMGGIQLVQKAQGAQRQSLAAPAPPGHVGSPSAPLPPLVAGGHCNLLLPRHDGSAVAQYQSIPDLTNGGLVLSLPPSPDAWPRIPAAFLQHMCAAQR